MLPRGLWFLGFGVCLVLLSLGSEDGVLPLALSQGPSAPFLPCAKNTLGFQVVFYSSIWQARSSQSLRSDRSRRFPSNVAVVQAFQCVISINLQNGTVNYMKDLLRATPSVPSLMPALTTLPLGCNSHSFSKVTMKQLTFFAYPKLTLLYRA